MKKSIRISAPLALLIALLIALMLHPGCTAPGLPYEVVDDYTFVQKEDRRNDSTPWELVEKTDNLTTSGRFCLTM